MRTSAEEKTVVAPHVNAGRICVFCTSQVLSRYLKAPDWNRRPIAKIGNRFDQWDQEELIDIDCVDRKDEEEEKAVTVI